MTALVDSSAVLAYLDAADPRHARAKEWLVGAKNDREPLIMHSYTEVESSALVQRRLGATSLRALHQDLAPLFERITVDPALHAAAVAALLAALPTKTSLVDYVSFEIMRDRGIRRAFAFDRDFVSAGFETVP